MPNFARSIHLVQSLVQRWFECLVLIGNPSAYDEKFQGENSQRFQVPGEAFARNQGGLYLCVLKMGLDLVGVLVDESVLLFSMRYRLLVMWLHRHPPL
jgi:hypothetical protein